MRTAIVKSPSVASAIHGLSRHLVYPYTSSPFYKERGLTDYLVSNCPGYLDNVLHPVPPDNRNRLTLWPDDRHDRLRHRPQILPKYW